MKSLYRARELLSLRGVWSQEMGMVLFAMLEEGWGYAEALRAYSDFSGMSRTEIERKMEEACRAAGRWTGARYILEDCYREAIR